MRPTFLQLGKPLQWQLIFLPTYTHPKQQFISGKRQTAEEYETIYFPEALSLSGASPLPGSQCDFSLTRILRAATFNLRFAPRLGSLENFIQGR
jgi:hypothetical protein